MTNTKVSNNNPEKDSNLTKSGPVEKAKVISKDKSIQTKKVSSISKQKDESLDHRSNEIFSELIAKKNSLVKEIKDLEIQRTSLINDVESNFKGQSDNVAKKVMMIPI